MRDSTGDAGGAGGATGRRSRTTEPAHLPLLEESGDTAACGGPKPTWRGWIHAVTARRGRRGPRARRARGGRGGASGPASVFALTSLLLFGNSALYHRVDWSPRVKLALKRIDHANIFLLIAGTYTPLALLALPPAQGAAAARRSCGPARCSASLFRVFWIDAPRWLYVALYLALGWAAVVYFVALFAANPAMMLLVIVGGLLYTAGAIVYGAEAAEPVARPLRVPRDLPRLHGAGVPLPLDGDAC